MVFLITVLYPMMNIPLFIGPLYKVSTYKGVNYTDFYFICRIQYPLQTVDDGSRFFVGLAFNGPTATGRRYVTNSTSLDVIFTSTNLRGNLGKLASSN